MDTLTNESVTQVPVAQAETFVANTDVVAEDTAPKPEEGLLAGKFKTAEDMEKAYLELQKKLGAAPAAEEEASEETSEETTEDGEQETAEETEENPYGPVVSEALKAAELSLDDVRKQYADNNGDLPDETYEALGKAGFPRAMVESYLRGLESAAGDVADEAAKTVKEIKDSVGGEEEFQKIVDYVSKSFSPEQRDAYNAMINSGDAAKAKQAVAVAAAEYEKSIGSETPLVAGGKAPAANSGYSSEAEMLEDFAKPEYKTSQTFRDKVQAKIAASPNLMMVR